MSESATCVDITAPPGADSGPQQGPPFVLVIRRAVHLLTSLHHSTFFLQSISVRFGEFQHELVILPYQTCIPVAIDCERKTPAGATSFRLSPPRSASPTARIVRAQDKQHQQPCPRQQRRQRPDGQTTNITTVATIVTLVLVLELRITALLKDSERTTGGWEVKGRPHR